MRFGLRSVLGFVAVAAAVAGAAPVATAAGWSAPEVVDHDTVGQGGRQMNAVSCPSRHLCVAVDAVGQVLSSDGPGAGSWRTVWDPGRPLVSLSCPSVHLCVAGDDDGHIYASRAPARGWRLVFTHTGDVSSISCPSAALCVAIQPGFVLTSSDPAAGSRHWMARRSLHPLQEVSCPSTHLCAAIAAYFPPAQSSAGPHATWVATSIDPSGGAWHYQTFNGSSHNFYGISCPSQKLCVVGYVETSSGAATVMTSTTPAAGGWHHGAYIRGLNVLPGSNSLLYCELVQLCIAGGAGAVWTTDQPTARSAWSRATLPKPTPPDPYGTDAVEGAACPGPHDCVLVDGDGFRAFSTSPLSGRWTLVGVDRFDPFTGVACPNRDLCVATDAAGRVLTSTNPGGGERSWRAVPVAPGSFLAGVACPSAGLCVAVGRTGSGTGLVLTSTNPAGDASAWQPQVTSSGLSPSSVTCPATSLCLVAAGPLLWSSDPTGGSSQWHQMTLDQPAGAPPGLGNPGAPASLTSVACASTSLCIASDGVDMFGSTAPTTGAWSGAFVDSAEDATGISGLSCPSASLCVFVDGSGDVDTSTTPADANSWAGQVPGGGHDSALGGVTCATTSLCYAFGANPYTGGIGGYRSTNPTGGSSAWTPQTIDPSGIPTAITCMPSGFCVAVDDHGQVLVRR